MTKKIRYGSEARMCKRSKDFNTHQLEVEGFKYKIEQLDNAHKKSMDVIRKMLEPCLKVIAPSTIDKILNGKFKTTAILNPYMDAATLTQKFGWFIELDDFDLRRC